MQSGFITPTEKIELAPHELIPFAHDYCKKHNLEDFEAFARQYEKVDPAYEYVLRVLKWIQVGTVVEPGPAYVLADPNSKETLEVRELTSYNYGELQERRGRFLSRITYLNHFAFTDKQRNYQMKSGFIMQNGTYVSYKSCTHFLIATSLANYFGANNETFHNYFSIYDSTCYEDLFVGLLGFIKVRVIGHEKVLMYTPELANLDQKKLIKDYRMLGFRIDKIKPYSLETSKEMIKTIKF